MRLSINEDYLDLRQEVKDLLHDSFDIMQDVLGLTQHNELVAFEFISSFDPRAVSNAAAWINGSKRYPMDVKCMTNQLLGCVITSVSHEFVHARDMVKGDLKTEDAGVWYKGQFTPAQIVQLAYSGSRDESMIMPHEYEAYTVGPRVAREVFRRLPVKYLRSLAGSVASPTLARSFDATEIRNALCTFAEQN